MAHTEVRKSLIPWTKNWGPFKLKRSAKDGGLIQRAFKILRIECIVIRKIHPLFCLDFTSVP